jgi:FdhD protein
MDHPRAERTKRFEVRRIKARISSRTNEDLVIEQTISLIVNGEKLLSFQCLPEMVEELAVGFLITEGLAPSVKEIRKVTFDAKVQQAVVDLQVSRTRLREFRDALVSGSSCGKALSSGAPFDPLDCRRKIDLGFHVEADALLGAMREFRTRSAQARRPRGVHAAAIARDAEILAFAEDIGRHNAVDKVVGACVSRGEPLHDKMLLTTGRITLEVTAKGLRAGTPVIASTHGPTGAAVELARNAFIAVAGFVAASSMTVYSTDWRIT